MKRSDIQIRRGDKPLREIEPESIPEALEKGDLLPTDEYLDRIADTWKPLKEWKVLPGARKKFFPTLPESPSAPAASPVPPTPAPEPAKPAPEPVAPKPAEETPKRWSARPTGVARISDDPAAKVRRLEESSSASAEEDSESTPLVKLDARQLKRLQHSFVSWGVAAFFLIVAFGFWLHTRNLSNELKNSGEELQGLRDTIASQQAEIDTLNLLSPAGQVRCMVTYVPSHGQVVGMINVTVLLYHRADVEKALLSNGLADTKIAEGTYAESIRKLKAALPPPAAVSLTSSNGRAEFSVPEPGDYVIACMPTRKIGGVTAQFLWLVGFEARNQPTRGILLSSENAVSPANPEFAIHDVAAFAANVGK